MDRLYMDHQTIIENNREETNRIEFSPSYRTDRIRLYIKRVNDPESRQLRLSDVKIWVDRPVKDSVYTDGGLLDGKYNYRVTAVDYYGFESSPSDEVQVEVGDTEPPVPPQGLVATASGPDVLLTWMPNTEPDLAGYNIYRLSSEGWSRINEVLITSPEYTDRGLSNGIYTYRVTAIDAVGNESMPSNEASATVYIGQPGPPLNLTITAPAEGASLVAIWQYSGGASGYNLYRGTVSGGPYSRVNSMPIRETTYTDRGLTNGTTYYYVVTAVDAYGNESAYSNEAMGIPEDTVAPAPPLLYHPIYANESVKLNRKRTVVAGSAEPGATIEVYRNNLIERVVTSRIDDGISKYLLDAETGYITLSRDGRHAVYERGGSIWFMSLDTGLSEMVVPEGYAPVLSPEGDKIAYGYFEDGTLRIRVYDLTTHQDTTLTDDLYSVELDPVWSADGTKIAFVSNREDNRYNVWVADLKRDSLTRITNVDSAAMPRFSPDMRWMTFFEGQTLYIVDLSTEEVREIDSLTDGYTGGWSPDSKRVAFISYREGRPGIYIMDVITGHQYLLVSSPGIYDLLWLPDGRGVGYLTDEGGLSSLWIKPTDSEEERVLIEGLLPGASMLSSGPGTIAFREEDSLFIVELKGHFIIRDVALEEGENTFYATAVDDSDNRSKQSDRILVILNTENMPDLEISDSDIYIYPTSPVEGEEVVINLVIWNRGEADANNVEVDLYVWDSSGEMDLLKTESIEKIPAHSASLVTAEWNSRGHEGVNRIIGVVDPLDGIDEVRESNNYSIKEFRVADREGLLLRISTDSEQYRSMEDVVIDITLSNSGREVDGILRVTVEDANGDEVARVCEIEITMPYASEERYSCKWNTDLLYAGQYRIHTVVLAEGGVIAEDTVMMVILPDIDVDILPSTDRSTYRPKEDVKISVEILNNGLNYIVPEIILKLKILDPMGSTAFAEDQRVTMLLPMTSVKLKSLWNTGVSLPGDYTLVVEGYLDGQFVSHREMRFWIEPEVMFNGRIVSMPSTLGYGNNFRIDYQIKNTGNVSAKGVTVEVQIMDPDSHNKMDSRQEVFDLSISGTHRGTFYFSTDGLSLKRYRVVLQVEFRGVTYQIDAGHLTIIDNRPPLVEVLTPEEGGHYNSEFIISVLVEDDGSGVENVEYRMDEGDWQKMALSDPASHRYMATFKPTNVDEGDHVIYLRATDREGNQSIPVSVHITIDFTPPEPPRILYPEDGAYLSSEEVEIKGVAEPGALVEMGFIEVFQSTADPETGEFSFTVNILPGKNVLLFTAKDRAGNISRTIRYTLYLGRLDVKKSISLKPRVLVWFLGEDRRKAPCRLNRDGGGRSDDCTDLIEFIEDSISGMSGIYKMVIDEEDFIESFRSAIYNTYIIVDLHDCGTRGDQHKRQHLRPEIQRELRESIFRGEGVVVVKNHPSEWPELRKALGVKIRGRAVTRGDKVVFSSSEISEETVAEFYGTYIQVENYSGEVVGSFKDGDNPSVVINRFGNGSTVLFTFNPVDIVNREVSTQIFQNALYYVSPKEQEIYPYSVVSVYISLMARYRDFEVKVSEEVPDEVVIVHSSEGFKVDGHSIKWEGVVKQDTIKELSYMVRIPDRSGSYLFTTEVFYVTDSSVSEQERTIIVSVDKTLGEIMDYIIYAISEVGYSNSKVIVNILKRIQQRPTESRRDIEKSIRDILRVVELIEDIDIDGKEDLRLTLDRILVMYGVMWSESG